MKQSFKILLLVLLFCAAPVLSLAEDAPLQIVDMKAAQNVDEKFQPVNPAESFPAATAKVFCWFKWKDGQVNDQIVAKWTYLTEKISILDYKVTLPRHEGSGGVAMSMPEGKTLPPGLYEIKLTAGGKELKSTQFTVLEK